MYCSLQESMIWYDTRVHTVHRLDKQHDDDSSEQMKNASPIESNLDMNQSKTDANCARRNPIVTSKVLFLSLLSLFWQISFFIFLYSRCFDRLVSLSFFTRCFDRFQIGGTLLDTVVSCGVPILNILSSATNTNTNTNTNTKTNKGIAMLCRSFVCLFVF